MPSDAETAWAAGIFEGEGCIYLPESYNGIVLKIDSTDRDIIERFHSIVGIGNVSFDKDNGSDAEVLGFKSIHTWRTSTYESSVYVLKLLYDWFGLRRKAKADEALARKINRRIDWTHCSYGHEYTEENTYIVPSTSARRCRQCARDRDSEWRERKKIATVQS